MEVWRCTETGEAPRRQTGVPAARTVRGGVGRCIARRMQSDFHHGLLVLRALDPRVDVRQAYRLEMLVQRAVQRFPVAVGGNDAVCELVVAKLRDPLSDCAHEVFRGWRLTGHGRRHG